MPERTLRFAVGAPDGPRSSTFRLWANTTTQDVYLAARAMADTMKVSLHETGSWSYSYVNNDKNQERIAQLGNRHVEIWHRPPEFGPGWTSALTIVVPDTDLRTWAHEDHRDTFYADPPAPGNWIWFEVLLADSARMSPLQVENAIRVGAIDLGSNRHVHVLARQAAPSPMVAGSLAKWRDQWLTSVSQRHPGTLGWALTDESARLVMWGQDSNQTRMLVDIASSKPKPGRVPICDGAGLLQVVQPRLILYPASMKPRD